MQLKLDDRTIRKIFSEIVAGYSLSKYYDEVVFIKHLSSIDLLEFDFRYEEILNSSKERGIPSEKEKIELLIENGLWDKGKEVVIQELRETLNMLHENKRKHYAPADIESFNKQIKANEESLIILLTDRMMAIGECAETLARKKIDTLQVFHSFYKDSELYTQKFPENSADELEEEDVVELLDRYGKVNKSLSDYTLKCISISNDFQIMYGLTDSLYEFYGRPVSKLTQYQLRLCSFGNYFKTIFAGKHKPPISIIDDPDKIEDWYFARNNVEKLLSDGDDNEGKTTGIMGVTRKDLEFLGIEVGKPNEKNSLHKAAREAGGRISGEDMVKLGLI